MRCNSTHAYKYPYTYLDKNRPARRMRNIKKSIGSFCYQFFCLAFFLSFVFYLLFLKFPFRIEVAFEVPGFDFLITFIFSRFYFSVRFPSTRRVFFTFLFMCFWVFVFFLSFSVALMCHLKKKNSTNSITNENFFHILFSYNTTYDMTIHTHRPIPCTPSSLQQSQPNFAPAHEGNRNAWIFLGRCSLFKLVRDRNLKLGGRYWLPTTETNISFLHWCL